MESELLIGEIINVSAGMKAFLMRKEKLILSSWCRLPLMPYIILISRLVKKPAMLLRMEISLNKNYKRKLTAVGIKQHKASFISEIIRNRMNCIIVIVRIIFS